MATSTYGTFLMQGTEGGSSTTWSEFIPIKSTPDLMPSRDQLDATGLGDDHYIYIPGIRKADGSLEFKANYDLDYVKKIEALEGKLTKFAVWFGCTTGVDGTATPTGEYGKFVIEGYVSYSVPGAEVNAVRELNIDIMPAGKYYRDTTSK